MRRDRDRHLRALGRLLEGQRDRGLEVLAALGRPASCASGRRRLLKIPDRMSENEPKSVAVAPPAAAAAGAAERVAAGEDGAAAVVLLALLGIAQGVVGLGDRLEALLGPGVLVGVRVVLPGQLAVRLLDLLLGGLLVDPEGLVVVGTARHRYRDLQSPWPERASARARALMPPPPHARAAAPRR